jgi:hypothetical protein
VAGRFRLYSIYMKSCTMSCHPEPVEGWLVGRILLLPHLIPLEIEHSAAAIAAKFEDRAVVGALEMGAVEESSGGLDAH